MTIWIVSSAALCLLVIALRYALRGRIDPRLQYALWGLVLLRLLIPGTLFSAPVSVAQAAQPLSAVEERVDSASLALPFGGPMMEFPDMDSYVSYVEVHRTVGITGGKNPEMRDFISSADGVRATFPVTIPWRALLRGAWYGGMAAMALALLGSNLTFALRLRRSRRKVDITYSRLPVYTCDGLKTPCLFGLLKPSIYITEKLADDPEALRHVLTHEETHYRHGDHWWGLLRGLCLVLHWYDPLVWWAAVLSRRDAEQACDADALRRLGEETRGAYGRTLIDLSIARPGGFDLLSCATTMTGGKRALRERVQRIAEKPNMKKITLAAVLCIALLAVGCAFAGAKPAASEAPDAMQTPSPVLAQPSEPYDGLNIDGLELERYVQGASVWTLTLSGDKTAKDTFRQSIDWGHLKMEMQQTPLPLGWSDHYLISLNNNAYFTVWPELLDGKTYLELYQRSGGFVSCGYADAALLDWVLNYAALVYVPEGSIPSADGAAEQGYVTLDQLFSAVYQLKTEQAERFCAYQYLTDPDAILAEYDGVSEHYKNRVGEHTARGNLMVSDTVYFWRDEDGMTGARYAAGVLVEDMLKDIRSRPEDFSYTLTGYKVNGEQAVFDWYDILCYEVQEIWQPDLPQDRLEEQLELLVPLQQDGRHYFHSDTLQLPLVEDMWVFQAGFAYSFKDGLCGDYASMSDCPRELLTADGMISEGGGASMKLWPWDHSPNYLFVLLRRGNVWVMQSLVLLYGR